MNIAHRGRFSSVQSDLPEVMILIQPQDLDFVAVIGVVNVDALDLAADLTVTLPPDLLTGAESKVHPPEEGVQRRRKSGNRNGPTEKAGEFQAWKVWRSRVSKSTN